ncbi:hypothetical protein JAO29_08325 [Edaphobacter sp. HDX4]|uniref:hypothetical protein n=1 Tax=Edaphobacter sp. HDX4 TaxID=2794064 RepID=UPI002FE543CE
MFRRRLASVPFLALVPVACMVLYAMHQAAVLYTSPSGHDQSWYLIAANRVLNGAQMYGPYVSDTNPPLVVWFSVLPVLMSRIFPMSATMCLRLLVFVLLMGSTIWSMRMLRRWEVVQRGAVRAFGALAILYVGLRIDPWNFGQREHLFVILALPYLFAIGTGEISGLSRAERCALGVAAGIAICFKPHQALAIIAAELVLALDRRSPRRLISPEVLALIATGAAYLLAVRVVTPAYTRQIVPLLVETYWAYGTSSVFALVMSMELRIVVALVLLGLSVFVVRSHPFSLTAAVFGAASVGSSFAYALQRTDWPYHRSPSSAFLILSATFFVLSLLPAPIGGWERYSLNGAVAAVCLTAAVAAGLGFFPRQLRRPPVQRSDVYRFLKEQGQPGTVLVFSTTVGWLADVADLGWQWGARFPCLSFFPAIVLNEQGPVDEERPFKQLSATTLAAVSKVQRDEIAQDLNHFQPSIVMIEQCDDAHECQTLEGRNVDTLAWFQKDSGFRQAWSHYAQQPNGPAAFALYRRVR